MKIIKLHLLLICIFIINFSTKALAETSRSCTDVNSIGTCSEGVCITENNNKIDCLTTVAKDNEQAEIDNYQFTLKEIAFCGNMLCKNPVVYSTSSQTIDVASTAVGGIISTSIVKDSNFETTAEGRIFRYVRLKLSKSIRLKAKREVANGKWCRTPNKTINGASNTKNITEDQYGMLTLNIGDREPYDLSESNHEYYMEEGILKENENGDIEEKFHITTETESKGDDFYWIIALLENIEQSTVDYVGDKPIGSADVQNFEYLSDNNPKLQVLVGIGGGAALEILDSNLNPTKVDRAQSAENCFISIEPPKFAFKWSNNP